MNDVRTRHNVLRVCFVIVLNKTETIHELDFNDVASAMFFEEILDFLLAGCCGYMSAVQKVINVCQTRTDHPCDRQSSEASSSENNE